jgi:LysR family glycine cleavage system transcriptional activator
LAASVTGPVVGRITRGRLADEALAAGLLVQPFDLELPSECGYYFVVPELRADQPKIQAFRAWLLDEVAAAAGEPRARPDEAAPRQRAGVG